MSDSLEKARMIVDQLDPDFPAAQHDIEFVAAILDQVRAEAREEAFKEAIAATNERIKHSGSLEVLRSVLETKHVLGPASGHASTTPTPIDATMPKSQVGTPGRSPDSITEGKP